MEAVPGFNGKKSIEEMENMLEKIGCFVAVQPDFIAPAERTIRDHAQLTQTLDHTEMLASKFFIFLATNYGYIIYNLW